MTPGVALQMYTVRKQFAENPQRCMADLAQVGYRAVEFAGFAGMSPQALRTALDDEGLTAISSHIDIPEFENDLAAVADTHNTLGCRWVVIQQAATADFVDVDAVRSLADRCNEWGQALAKEGLRLGYHGYHDFENEFAVDDGVRRWDLFVSHTDAELVDIQLDTYWVQYVGDDPVQSLHRLRGRVAMLHAKDVRPDGTGDTPVGTGTTAWDDVLAAAVNTDVEWLVVEQEDDPDNALRDVATSRENLLARLGLLDSGVAS